MSSVSMNDPKITGNVFDVLIIGFVSILTLWFIQSYWNRRKLLEYSKDVQGPLALPLIGSSFYFIGSPYDILSNFMWVAKTYPGLCKFWHGRRLFYFVSTPEHVEVIMNSPKAVAKEELYKYVYPLLGHGLVTAPVKTWRKHRKIILPTLNQRILDKFVVVFTKQSKVLVEQLKKHCGKGEVDLFHLITACTLDIVCETAMGVQVNAQTCENLFGKHVDNFMEKAFLRMFNLLYQYDFIYNLTYHSRSQNKSLKFLKEFTGKVITTKRIAFDKMMAEKLCHEAQIEDDKNRKAFLDYLFIITDQEKDRFSDEELQEEVHTFMVAGSDTSATTISFVFTIFGLFPDIQQRVYKEVLDNLGPDRDMEPSDMSKLKYLECVIKETLRLFPVGAFIVRALDDDITLKNGKVLPKGSSAVIAILHTHRNAEYWTDPLKFDPDRFLPEEVAKRPACSYLPFSYGLRNCIGTRFAMMTMKTIISTVVRSYKVKTSYKSIEEIHLKTNVMLRPRDGYKVSFEARH